MVETRIGSTASEACPPARACRSDRGAPRDTFRAAPGTIRSATPRPGVPRRACAAATTAFAHQGGVAAAAGRGRRSHGIAPRTATSTPAAGARVPRPRRHRAAAATDPGAFGVGKADDESFVTPHHLDVHAGALAYLRRDRHGPRRVNPAAERGEQAHSPVSKLVEAPLDHQRPVIRHRASCRLVVQVAHQVLRGRRSRSCWRTSRSIAALRETPRSSRTSPPIA